ncbi:MAG: YIP1 family protein [Candidatus Obscuribacterales bacterium]|nr:YIP1 family protein [Candidatus Obscuribacterales bacterium]
MDSLYFEGDKRPRWAELFQNILIAPVKTIHQLNELCDVFSASALSTQAFNTVFLSGLILGAVRFKPDSALLSIFSLLGAITDTMVVWVVVAGILTILSAALPGARSTRWTKALVLTGWSMAPVIFFAPILCYKNLLGPFILPFATIPTWWTLFLLATSYKVALNVSAKRLFLVLLILPPILFFVYFFWTSLSICFFASELISVFQR